MPGSERVGPAQARHDLPLLLVAVARLENYLQYRQHERHDVRIAIENVLARLRTEQARLEWAVEHEDLGDGHGSIAMYQRRCRCVPCKTARRSYDRDRVERGIGPNASKARV